MNEKELLRQLEAATAKPLPNGQKDSIQAPDTDGLRESWRRLSAQLAQCDQACNTDQTEFLSRVLTSLDEASGVAPCEPPSVRAAAIVACGRTTQEPTGWKAWLALVACVALCGAAVFWFDFGEDRAPVTQNDPAKSKQGPKTQNSETSPPSEAGNPGENSVPDIELAHVALPAWTDPVDDDIAAAGQQLLAMQATTRWDRSVRAFEQYRQSVEQEMNEWER